MRKKLVLLVVCFMFVGASSFAEPEQQYTWKMGTEISHRDYEEPGVMEEKGMMYGILCSYTQGNDSMLRLEGLFGFGEVDYDSGASGTLNDVDDYLWEFRGLGLYDFTPSRDNVLAPYIGMGYRYLKDELGPGKATLTGDLGYERESTYIYSPIGIEGTRPLVNGWSIGFTAEYDYFWQGTQRSHLGWIPGYWDVENDQEKGYGIRGSLALTKKGENVDCVIEPFIRYWRIDDSEVTTDPGGTSWIEPKNNTKEFGIKVTAKFAAPDLKPEPTAVEDEPEEVAVDPMSQLEDVLDETTKYRLKRLESFYEDGSITEAEYKAGREAILE